MSSEARDAALTGGKPVRLFKFTRATTHWFYTDADRPIVFGGDTYASIAIAHTEIRDNGEPNQAGVKITLPKTVAVADNWRPYPPAETISISIFTLHVGEVDVLLDYGGRVIKPQFDDVSMTLHTEPTSTRARRGGGQRRCQRACDLVVFSQGPGRCNVDPEDHKFTAVLTAVDGVTLTAAAFGGIPDGRLAGGTVEWLRGDGFTERRGIVSHTGTSIVIDYPAAELAVALELEALPGCRQDWASCLYFENTDRFGGEPYMPDRDYFNGNPI